MRVAILHEDFRERPDAPLVDRGVLGTVVAVRNALEALGHAPVSIEVDAEVPTWTRRLRDARADVVFNLVEGLGGCGADEARVTGVVELLRIPCTGSSADAQALAVRKDRVHALLAAAGLPTVRSVVARGPADVLDWARFPAIVKPVAEDGSIGIEQSSVVTNLAELASALGRSTVAGPLLVQEFLTGVELAVGLVGPCALPVSQIDFSSVPAGRWPLLTFDAKWDTASVDCVTTPSRCPADIEPRLREQVVEIAQATWELVGGRGYGRVDLRADAAGRPFVLEVNPNPDLAPDAGLALMAAAQGWTYVELIGRILREARA